MRQLASLTAKTANLDAVFGSSSNDRITKAEQAHVLTGLSDMQLLTIYAIELLDRTALLRLKLEIWRWFIMYWCQDNDKDRIPDAIIDTLHDLCFGVVAVIHHHPHGVLCPCGGDAHCIRCNGTRKQPFSIVDLMDKSGLARSTLSKKNYRKYAKIIYQKLHSEHIAAIYHVQHKYTEMKHAS